MGTRQEFIKKLAKIQKELKAPKSQYNKFGNYNYRNAEDILEALKPFLGELSLTIDEDVIVKGTGELERFYVKSTVTLTDGENEQSVSAFAREPEEAKGMSAGQITGASSSYASKYALGKLFLLDDTKDADTNEAAEQAGKGKQEKSDKPSRFQRKPKVEQSTEHKEQVVDQTDKSEPTPKQTEELNTQEDPPIEQKRSFRSFRRK